MKRTQRHWLLICCPVATTAAVFDSHYYAVPAGCLLVYARSRPYYYCGGTYYEKQMQGDIVVCVVVQP